MASYNKCAKAHKETFMFKKRLFGMIPLFAVVILVFLSLIGCDDSYDNHVGFVGNRIIVNNAQVYDNDNSVINGTESLSWFGDWIIGGGGALSSFFTNPVVNIVNGKLTIDLGEPVNLLSIDTIDTIVSEFGIILTISDSSAKFHIIDTFFGEDFGIILCLPGYFGGGDMYIYFIVSFIYVDKPVTVKGDLPVGLGGLFNSVDLNLVKGWNTALIINGVFKNSNVNITGSGTHKWFTRY